jgi:hypothetical protein
MAYFTVVLTTAYYVDIIHVHVYGVVIYMDRIHTRATALGGGASQPAASMAMHACIGRPMHMCSWTICICTMLHACMLASASCAIRTLLSESDRLLSTNHLMCVHVKFCSLPSYRVLHPCILRLSRTSSCRRSARGPCANLKKQTN